LWCQEALRPRGWVKAGGTGQEDPRRRLARRPSARAPELAGSGCRRGAISVVAPGRPGSPTISAMSTLILIRHGESEWNAKGLFTGWVDVALSERGRAEAAEGGRQLAEAGLRPHVVHTSALSRAIETANIAQDVAGLAWLPVRRSWRLNERHYGALQGKNKAETREKYGDEQFMLWRRSYDIPPPPLPDDDPLSQAADPRYALLPDELLPRTECLRDVVNRLLPYWYDAIISDLAGDRVVLVVAHGNSLRALVKHLDGISDADIAELNIPTGMPLVYQLSDRFRPLGEGRYLDPEAASAAAEAVKSQGR
jgi:2,3-bisphosphoglycerate-dependent phosphoglycerate mutase